MKRYLCLYPLGKVRGGLLWMSRSSVTPPQLDLQPPDFGALVRLSALYYAGLAELAQPSVQAVRGDTQSLGDLCHLEPTIGPLAGPPRS
ncbi:hypothetical protein XACJK2_1480017 [Xanthomonas citri pv. citri]|nr:hypothetical protein XACJK2_1480017 [Xanthomonas citri pv. citri]